MKTCKKTDFCIRLLCARKHQLQSNINVLIHLFGKQRNYDYLSTRFLKILIFCSFVNLAQSLEIFHPNG